jgi:hypothetical protein
MCLKVESVPWCQILIDDPAARDERSFKRLMRHLPAVGDLIDVDEEKVVVTSVTLIPPRTMSSKSVTALVYCRQHESLHGTRTTWPGGPTWSTNQMRS